MKLQWKMKFSFLYRLSKNTEQSEYMWWPHMAFFLEIRWESSKTIRTLFRKLWCPTLCHNLPTKLFYLNICTSSISVVIFYFFTKAHSQFSRFLFIPFPDIFLVKKLQHIFFSVKSQCSHLDCYHLMILFQHVLDYWYFYGFKSNRQRQFRIYSENRGF